MCFNPTVSIITYLIGMIGTYQLYKLNLFTETVFYGWVIQMQLLEFFIWKLQPCNQIPNITENNIKVSKIANIVNHLEPFALWFAIIYFSNVKLGNNIHNYMYLYSIITILYTYNVFTSTECTTVTDISKPNLYWKWNEGPYFKQFYTLFLITLLILSYYGFRKPTNLINIFLISVSYFISYYIYRDKHTVGAMWCFAAAFAPWIIIHLYKYFQVI